MSEKHVLQEEQYAFPYHYLAQLPVGRAPQIGRVLRWGFEYLSYMSYILDQIRDIAPTSVLDVGCGDGWMLNTLSRRPYLRAGTRLHGIDLSSRALAFARAFGTDVTFSLENIQNIQDRHELVCLIEVLEHIPDVDIASFVRGVANTITDGGYLIVSVPTTVVPTHPKHYRHYDEGLLTEHLDMRTNGLETQSDQRIYRETRAFKLGLRALSNKIYTVSSDALLARFWSWHAANTLRAGTMDGQHLVRVCRKKRGGRV